MRVASTGLGTTEMVCSIGDLKPNGDLLVLKARTSEPAEWDLEISIQPEDVPIMIKGFLKPSVIWTYILSFLWPQKNPKEPESL